MEVDIEINLIAVVIEHIAELQVGILVHCQRVCRTDIGPETDRQRVALRHLDKAVAHQLTTVNKGGKWNHLGVYHVVARVHKNQVHIVGIGRDDFERTVAEGLEILQHYLLHRSTETAQVGGHHLVGYSDIKALVAAVGVKLAQVDFHCRSEGYTGAITQRRVGHSQLIQRILQMLLLRFGLCQRVGTHPFHIHQRILVPTGGDFLVARLNPEHITQENQENEHQSND